MPKIILLTGVAGFIGSHTAEKLLQRGDHVVGLDNLNDYYEPSFKHRNLEELRQRELSRERFTFIQGDFRDRDLVRGLFEHYRFDAILHLGAMAGVRASIENPSLYYDVNLNGTLVLLDAAVSRLSGKEKNTRITPFVLATTSSVYGATQHIPFVESDPCARPLAPYAASKRAAELLGYTYHHLFGLPFTGLRFFTVYGPRNRPDMMAYKIVDNIFFGRQVPLYNHGQMHRDWTYVDDIVAGVIAAVDQPLGHELINLGRGEPVLLADFVHLIEELTGCRANLTPAPMPEEDMPSTYADISKARQLLGYDPKISIREGVTRFWQWYERVILKKDR